MGDVIEFFIKAALLGMGLAMDAFSVSLANGLAEPNMKKRKLAGIAGIFAGFQFIMPMIGWFCVHTLASMFTAFQKFIPWIALVLLCFIGGKMLIEGLKKKDEGKGTPSIGLTELAVQGVATSIDALSVGFTIAEYDALSALAACLVIGVLTFIICAAGVFFGKKFGTAISGKATLFGGIILILIGIEIFITGIVG